MRIVLKLEYRGTNYHGWQRQQGLSTIQGHLEQALSQVANHAVEVTCAGRTDRGVHAKGQVIHFDTDAERPLKSWVLGANSNLPADIAVKSVHQVDENFHARFSATARSYRYLIYNHPIRSAIFQDLVTWHYQDLDANLMHQAAQYLIGEHDFSSFRGCDCQSKTPMRNVHEIKVTRQNKLVIIDIKANAFLMHMVRNIAGVLMLIGGGNRQPIWAKEVLAACDRRVGAATALAAGLYLQQVYYK